MNAVPAPIVGPVVQWHRFGLLIHCPHGCLDPQGGLCRAHGIEAEVGDLSLTDIYRADEVFCTGTKGEPAPMTVVDGQTIGDGRPGRMTGRLSEFFRELTAREGVVVVE